MSPTHCGTRDRQARRSRFGLTTNCERQIVMKSAKRAQTLEAHGTRGALWISVAILGPFVRLRSETGVVLVRAVRWRPPGPRTNSQPSHAPSRSRPDSRWAGAGAGDGYALRILRLLGCAASR